MRPASISIPRTDADAEQSLGGERRLRLAVALVLLVVAYAVAFAPLGASDPDDGLALAFAERVGQGERIYVDFIYSKPPLSPYLHAAALGWIPPAERVIAGRVAFYALVALYSALAAALLCREFGHRRGVGADVLLLAPAAFVFSAH